MQRIHEVVRVLPGQVRRTGAFNGNAVRAMAGRASSDDGRGRAGGAVALQRRGAGKERRHVHDVLVRQAGRLTVHGAVAAMFARARLVFAQRRDDVIRALTEDFRHMIGGVGVAVVGDAVAAVAGVGQLGTAHSVASSGLGRSHGSQRRQREGCHQGGPKAGPNHLQGHFRVLRNIETKRGMVRFCS